MISAIASAILAVISISAAWAGVHAYRLYGGLRLVTCPESAEAAIVKIRATRAIAARLVGSENVLLKSCSRWPARRGCNQACLAQAVAGRGSCRARALPAG